MLELQSELRRLSRLAGRAQASASQEAALTLVRAARQLLEKATSARRLEKERPSCLTLAQRAESLAQEGKPPECIARMLGWKSARRVRQMVAFASLPSEVHELILAHNLNERRLRPLLRWRWSPHFRTLVEWVGIYRLTARQVDCWCRALRQRVHLDLPGAMADLTTIHASGNPRNPTGAYYTAAEQRPAVLKLP